MHIEGVDVGEEVLLDGQPESRLVDLRPGGADPDQQSGPATSSLQFWYRSFTTTGQSDSAPLSHTPHDVIVSDGSVPEADGALRQHGAELPGLVQRRGGFAEPSMSPMSAFAPPPAAANNFGRLNCWYSFTENAKSRATGG